MRSFMIETELTLLQFRRALPAFSATALSIDRNDSWQHVAEHAQKEGYKELHAYLVLAQETFARQFT